MPARAARAARRRRRRAAVPGSRSTSAGAARRRGPSRPSSPAASPLLFSTDSHRPGDDRPLRRHVRGVACRARRSGNAGRTGPAGRTDMARSSGSSRGWPSRAGSRPLVGCYQFALAGLSPAALRQAAGAVSPARRHHRPRLERGRGDRADARPAGRPRIPGRPAADLRRRRREHRRDAGDRPQQGRGAPRDGVSTCGARRAARARPRRSTTASSRFASEGWYEAVLIIDADVILTHEALRMMTRHLADPDVGAVTAYIKEGSRPARRT